MELLFGPSVGGRLPCQLWMCCRSPMVGIVMLLVFFSCFQVRERDDQDYDAHDDKEKNL